ncbi:hypothetical protein [Salinicoccus bachuensis]|uniref:Uncharacterized protein n=1 Tax=Salinicoccus bachuensis TaxID=3136731 RepID=A0ABZ3CJG3_9STAP
MTSSILDFDETLEGSNRLNPAYEINEDVIQEMATISMEAGYIPSDDVEGLVNREYVDAVLEEE